MVTEEKKYWNFFKENNETWEKVITRQYYIPICDEDIDPLKAYKE